MTVHTDWRVDRKRGRITKLPHGEADAIFLICARGTDMVGAIERADIAAAAPSLLDALIYARRFLNADDHDTAFVDAALSKAKPSHQKPEEQ